MNRRLTECILPEYRNTLARDIFRLSCRPQFDHERILIPQRVHLLIHPISCWVAQLEIEIQQDIRHDKAHLMVREAFEVSRSLEHSFFRVTDFFPMQFRGPVEKVFIASRRSEPYICCPSAKKRSGLKLSGSLKFLGDRWMEYIGACTMVCEN
jgi:hypothetical protein